MMAALTADTVLTNCRLGDRNASIAVYGGRIAAIDDADRIGELVGPDTAVFDAAGRAVWPGFIDSHTHFHRASIMEEHYLNFAVLEPTSVDEVLALVRRRAAETPEGEWIQGDSLEFRRLREQRLPTRQELDAAAPGRCIVLRTVGRHALTASSAALELAGIDAHTPAPPGGRIERDRDGEPNGVLHEHGKLRLDMTRADTVVPKPDAAQRQRALQAGMARLAAHGITGIHDIVREPVEVGDYMDLDASDRLAVRIRMYVRGRESQTPLEYLAGLGLRAGFGSERLRIGGVKLSIDGDLANRNSAVYDAYPGEPDNRGLLRLTQDELTEAVVRSHQALLPVAIHAIGPRAVDMALDAIESARTARPQNRLKHRIEHAFFDQRGARLKRFADLNVVWSTQPSMLRSSGDAWLAAAGADFLDGVLPLRTALDLGVHVQINSDHPCSPLDPFVGLRACVQRSTRDGVPLAPDEAITVPEALDLMTRAPAATVGEQGCSGAVAVGHWADLIVLSSDPDAATDLPALGLRVDATFVGGDLVWERAAA